MEWLYIFICIIGVVVQIYSLVVVKELKDKKYWNIFMGISIAGFISVIMAYIALRNKALGLGDGIMILMVMAIGFCANLLMLIIGLIVKKKKQNEDIRLDKSFLLVSALVLVIYAVALWGIPALSHKTNTDKGKKVVLDYLEDKYGDGNYKVLNVYNEYASDGMWDAHLSGYYYEIKCSHMDEAFFVLVENEGYRIEQDYFLPVYFSQKNNWIYKLYYHEGLEDLQWNFDAFNNYLMTCIEEKYSMNEDKIKVYDVYEVYINYIDSDSETGYSSNFDIIPSNFGAIPTIEELADRAYIYLK